MRKRKNPTTAKTTLIGLAIVAGSTFLAKVGSEFNDDLGTHAATQIRLAFRAAREKPLPPSPPPSPARSYAVDLTPEGRPGPGILAGLAREANPSAAAGVVPLGLMVAGFDTVLAVNIKLSDWARGAHERVGLVVSDPDGASSLLSRPGSRWAEEFRKETGSLVVVVNAASAAEAVEMASEYFKSRAVQSFLSAWEAGCVGPMTAEVRQVRVQLGSDIEADISAYVRTPSSKSLDQLFGAVMGIVEAYEAKAIENHQANGT
ncbi:MAG: hypothetical protein IT207_00295 [Fimbriimonadaceae bacterium]|nr:hypothetical protein [Fimbriimonadaceae bacterium]